VYDSFFSKRNLVLLTYDLKLCTVADIKEVKHLMAKLLVAFSWNVRVCVCVCVCVCVRKRP
jgi:hypothetical protein